MLRCLEKPAGTHRGVQLALRLVAFVLFIMFRSFAALAVLAVALQGVVSFEFLGIDFGHTFDKISGVQRFTRDVGDGKPCKWGAFESVFQCCKFPPVVPDGFLKSCISSTLKSKKKVAGAKRIPGMTFACTADCALRKNEMILENGHADVEKLQEKFLEKADGSWKPVVSAAVDKCKEDMAKTNITEEGECKLANLHLIYCLFREVSMNCPQSSVPKDAENCDSKVSAIESCDPWSVMKDVESKVDSSLKTASAFLKNNNPFAKFADRFKNISGKSVMAKIDQAGESASEQVEKMVHKAKTGSKSFADKAKTGSKSFADKAKTGSKSLADKAKTFFARAKQSINVDN